MEHGMQMPLVHNCLEVAGESYCPATRTALPESSGQLQFGLTSGIDASMAPLGPPHVLPTQADHAGLYRLLQPQSDFERRQHDALVAFENPLAHAERFGNYRRDQKDKLDQIWPVELERFFLDAILLIPMGMGRGKYSMRGKQWGRNMLIGEYLWLCWKRLKGWGPDETLPKKWIKEWKRGRKQVSSHIQVCKNLFDDTPTFHFFFTGKETSERGKAAVVDKESLKNNPVLQALTRSEVTDWRPNYDYFRRIMAMNDRVKIKPKRFWLFLSLTSTAVLQDRSGHNAATNEPLHKAEFPWLAENPKSNTWSAEERSWLRGAQLLHQLAKGVDQVYSSTASELSRDWALDRPQLQPRIEQLIEDDGTCDILHMDAMLDVMLAGHIPHGSELNAFNEVSVAQEALMYHCWKVRSTVAWPAELAAFAGGRDVFEEQTEIEYHAPRCRSMQWNTAPQQGAGCACRHRPPPERRDVLRVPFPAKIWAKTLANCASFPPYPNAGQAMDEPRVFKSPLTRRDAVNDDDDDDDDDSAAGEVKEQVKVIAQGVCSDARGEPTQMDLVPKITMVQELWSAPFQDDLYGTAQPADDDTRQWTKQAVILWTFRTIYKYEKAKGGTTQLVAAPAGKASWRYLSVLDPASPDQVVQRLLSPAQQRALHTSRSASLTRDAALSPGPTFPHQLDASMSEAFASAWADAATSPTGPYPPPPDLDPNLFGRPHNQPLVLTPGQLATPFMASPYNDASLPSQMRPVVDGYLASSLHANSFSAYDASHARQAYGDFVPSAYGAYVVAPAAPSTATTPLSASASPSANMFDHWAAVDVVDPAAVARAEDHLQAKPLCYHAHPQTLPPQTLPPLSSHLSAPYWDPVAAAPILPEIWARNAAAACEHDISPEGWVPIDAPLPLLSGSSSTSAAEAEWELIANPVVANDGSGDYEPQSGRHASLSQQDEHPRMRQPESLLRRQLLPPTDPSPLEQVVEAEEDHDASEHKPNDSGSHTSVCHVRHPQPLHYHLQPLPRAPSSLSLSAGMKRSRSETFDDENEGRHLHDSPTLGHCHSQQEARGLSMKIARSA